MAIKSVGTRKVIDSSSAAISYAFETGPGVLATPVEWKGIRTITQGEFGPSLERYTTEEISPTHGRTNLVVLWVSQPLLTLTLSSGSAMQKTFSKVSSSNLFIDMGILQVIRLPVSRQQL